MQKQEAKTWENVFENIAKEVNSKNTGLATEIIKMEIAKSKAKDLSIVCLSIIIIVFMCIIIFEKVR